MKKIALPLLSGLALATTLCIATAKDTPRQAVPAYVKAAIADPVRAGDTKDDARRHGAEIVAFAGVKPGDKVLEIAPGGGYFTRIFSKVVGDKGHVYAVVPEPMRKYADATVKLPETLANVDVQFQPADALSAPQPVDVIFTSQNYHDYPNKMMGPTDPAVLDKAAFAALKPGGVFIVIDHATAAGIGMGATETLHRIDPATVKQQVEAAGFKLVGESSVLRNPADDHSLNVFDKGIRGHTDQFAYKFRKPMK